MVSVYKSSLTGHWIVDRMGTKQNPSSQREGFRKWPDALSSAVQIGDHQREVTQRWEALF